MKKSSSKPTKITTRSNSNSKSKSKSKYKSKSYINSANRSKRKS